MKATALTFTISAIALSIVATARASEFDHEYNRPKCFAVAKCVKNAPTCFGSATGTFPEKYIYNATVRYGQITTCFFANGTEKTLVVDGGEVQVGSGRRMTKAEAIDACKQSIQSATDGLEPCAK